MAESDSSSTEDSELDWAESNSSSSEDSEMDQAESESSSSEEDEFDWENFSPKKANDSNPFFSEDFSSFVRAILQYIKETKKASLELKSFGLTATEVKSVLQLLTHSYCKVTELNLEDNHFEDGMQDVFQILIKTKIKKLIISSCNLPKNNLMHLMEVLNDTKIIDLEICMNGIKLDIYETSKFTSFLLASRVVRLDYGGNKFEPATGALTFVHALPHMSITCLSLQNCSLHNEVLITLFSCIHHTLITDLNISRNEVTDEQIKELGRNLKASKLEKLNLGDNNISDIGIDILAAGLVDSNVVYLNISQNKFQGRNILGGCLKNTKIRELDLSSNAIKYCEMFSFPNFLKESSVVVLNMGDCQLGDDIGQKLMQCLKCSKLTELCLHSNKLGSLSLSEFANNVNGLKLIDIDFSDNKWALSDLVLFTDSLKSSKIESVSLCVNFNSTLGSEAVPLFLRATKGTTITTVNVGCNEISMKGAETIADMLGEGDFTVGDLGLHFNEIEDGLVKLAAYLKFSSLTRLRLHNNGINDTGAETLAKHLKETQIVTLDLGMNLITSLGAAALAAGLSGSNILYLDLEQNVICNKGLKALAEHVKNTFITHVDVSDNPGNRIYLVETVLLENRISEHRLLSFFKKIAPANNEAFFNFDHVIDNFSDGTALEDLFLFCKTLEQPIALTVLAEGEGISFSKSKIADLMKEFPQQFSMFVASKIKGSVSQHVSVLKRAEELGLNKIVEYLLLNRPIYTIDESQGILHPYVYNLLFKYKQPLYNLSIEPQSKMKIINYFTDHAEYSDASDVVHMLLNN